MINNETLLVEIADKYRIPIRILNILYSEDVKTVGQLMDFIPNLQMRHMGKKSLTIILDLQDALSQDMEQNKNDKKIDWEERRYSIAKSVVCAQITAPIIPGVDPNPSVPDLVKRSVLITDALIDELKKGGNQ